MERKQFKGYWDYDNESNFDVVSPFLSQSFYQVIPPLLNEDIIA
jgi:hypothetical protein